MSYPDYPVNRLIVNGVDITEKFKMVLSDGYSLKPPEPKTYTVDIPGGNGKLDLTSSLLGDTAYDNRTQEFTFYVIDDKNFEKTKTLVSNFLHGRSFDYILTFDPEYTYHGRFTVSEYGHSKYMNGIVGAIKVSVDSDPFKMKEAQVYNLDAVGGNRFFFESGRKRVRPVIETENFLVVIYKGKKTTLPSGSWGINEMLFEMGENEVYLNSYSIHNLTWGDLKTDGVTWKEFGEKRLYEWYKSKGNINIVSKTWGEVSDMTWRDMSAATWNDLKYIENITENVSKVRVSYEWGDL